MPVFQTSFKNYASSSQSGGSGGGSAGRWRNDSKFPMIYFCFAGRVPSWTRAGKTRICSMGRLRSAPPAPIRQQLHGPARLHWPKESWVNRPIGFI